MIDFGGGVRTGEGKCLVVAELGCNHNGDLGTAVRLVKECAAAGADVIKFQLYTLNEILDLRGEAGPVPAPWADKAKSMRELYVKARTPSEWLPVLRTACEQEGVPWFSSVFGQESLAYLEWLGCPVYKVAALDTGSDSLQAQVRATDKPIIASHPTHRVEWADLTLWCPPGYPQEWGAFRWPDDGMSKLHLDGLSFHGTSLNAVLCAVEYGVGLIEVHVQLDDEPSYLDAHSSLTVSQLKELCNA